MFIEDSKLSIWTAVLSVCAWGLLRLKWHFIVLQVCVFYRYHPSACNRSYILKSVKYMWFFWFISFYSPKTFKIWAYVFGLYFLSTAVLREFFFFLIFKYHMYLQLSYGFYLKIRNASTYQGLQKKKTCTILFQYFTKCFTEISVKNTNSWTFVSSAESDSLGVEVAYLHGKSIPYVFPMLLKFEKHC